MVPAETLQSFIEFGIEKFQRLREIPDSSIDRPSFALQPRD
jgi:hypothetical protein